MSEEGATQVFRPTQRNEVIVGAVGVLQFDVVAHRLKHEYKVECSYDNINVATARWVVSKDAKKLEEFKIKNAMNLSYDSGGSLAYLAPTMVNLSLAQERWPEMQFLATREH